jgi:hypothetical protein
MEPIGALGQGGPSARHVARSTLEEAEALPPRKGMCHAAARSSKALSGITHGLSPLPGREVYERRVSPEWERESL